MPPNVFAIAAIASILWFGASTVWHGAKKAGHAITCVFVYGKNCKK